MKAEAIAYPFFRWQRKFYLKQERSSTEYITVICKFYILFYLWFRHRNSLFKKLYIISLPFSPIFFPPSHYFLFLIYFPFLYSFVLLCAFTHYMKLTWTFLRNKSFQINFTNMYLGCRKNISLMRKYKMISFRLSQWESTQDSWKISVPPV